MSLTEQEESDIGTKWSQEDQQRLEELSLKGVNGFLSPAEERELHQLTLSTSLAEKGLKELSPAERERNNELGRKRTAEPQSWTEEEQEEYAQLQQRIDASNLFRK